MKLTSFEAATQFVSDRFPDCDVAFLSGSASRGEETETSDLDILIFQSNISDYRESFEDYGWRIECFVNTFESYHKYFKLDRDRGRPVLATMITEGIILKDTGKAHELKAIANDYIQQGPEALTFDYINASRYFMFDLLDDFSDAQNDEEAIITLHTLSIQLIDFILRLNGQWSGRGKTLTRAFNNFDAEWCKRFFDALNRYYQKNDKTPIIEFVHDVYRPLGGQLFAGFSMGKKHI